MVRCAIWYHSCNLENVKNTHGGVLILVKLQASILTLLHGCFSRFLSCTMVSNRATHHIYSYCSWKVSKSSLNGYRCKWFLDHRILVEMITKKATYSLKINYRRGVWCILLYAIRSRAISLEQISQLAITDDNSLKKCCLINFVFCILCLYNAHCQMSCKFA